MKIILIIFLLQLCTVPCVYLIVSAQIDTKLTKKKVMVLRFNVAKILYHLAMSSVGVIVTYFFAVDTLGYDPKFIFFFFPFIIWFQAELVIFITHYIHELRQRVVFYKEENILEIENSEEKIIMLIQDESLNITEYIAGKYLNFPGKYLDVMVLEQNGIKVYISKLIYSQYKIFDELRRRDTYQTVNRLFNVMGFSKF